MQRAVGRLGSLAGACLLLACAHGGTLKDGVFRKPELAYRITPPDGSWRALKVKGNDLAWAHTQDDATLQANGRCKEGDVPLLALTHHLLIGFTAQQVLEQRTLPLAAREALHTHALAKLDGVQRELMLVVLKKDGCVYDFSLNAAPGAAFHRHTPALHAMLAGFATEKGLKAGR